MTVDRRDDHDAPPRSEPAEAARVDDPRSRGPRDRHPGSIFDGDDDGFRSRRRRRTPSRRSLRLEDES